MRSGLQSVRMSLEILHVATHAFKLVTLRAVGFSSRTIFLWKILRKMNMARVRVDLYINTDVVIYVFYPYLILISLLRLLISKKFNEFIIVFLLE